MGDKCDVRYAHLQSYEHGNDLQPTGAEAFRRRVTKSGLVALPREKG